MTLQIYDLASGIYAVAKRSWASSPTDYTERWFNLWGWAASSKPKRRTDKTGRTKMLALKIIKTHRFTANFVQNTQTELKILFILFVYISHKKFYNFIIGAVSP